MSWARNNDLRRATFAAPIRNKGFRFTSLLSLYHQLRVIIAYAAGGFEFGLEEAFSPLLRVTSAFPD